MTSDNDRDRILNEITSEQFAFWRELMNDALNDAEAVLVSGGEMDHSAAMCAAGHLSVIMMTVNASAQDMVQAASEHLDSRELGVASDRIRSQAKVLGTHMREFAEGISARYTEATGETIEESGEELPEVDRTLN